MPTCTKVAKAAEYTLRSEKPDPMNGGIRRESKQILG